MIPVTHQLHTSKGPVLAISIARRSSSLLTCVRVLRLNGACGRKVDQNFLAEIVQKLSVDALRWITAFTANNHSDECYWPSWTGAVCPRGCRIRDEIGLMEKKGSLIIIASKITKPVYGLMFRFVISIRFT